MRLFCLLVFALCSFTASSQKIDDNTVVKDSAGTVYPAAIWKALMMKGSYTLKPEDRSNPTTAYFLVRLTDQQKEERLAKMPPPRESKFFKTGEKFNLGKMKDIQGNAINLKENEGKITVVNFWFINCPPCQTEIPDLNALVEKYGSDSVRFVAIALDSKSDLQAFLQTTSFKYNVVDDGRFLTQRYSIQSYPTHVIINKEGKVHFHTTGLSPNTVYHLEKNIKQLLATTEATASN